MNNGNSIKKDNKVEIQQRYKDDRDEINNYNKIDINLNYIKNDNNINRIDIEDIILSDKNIEKNKEPSKKYKEYDGNNSDHDNNNNNKSVKSNEDYQNESFNSTEKRQEIENDPILSKFDINLIKFADEIFDMYVENEKKEKDKEIGEIKENKDIRSNYDNKSNIDLISKKSNKSKNSKQTQEGNGKITLYEVQNLLEVLGIKKNDIEINCSIKKIKQEKPKKFSQDETYSKENFIDIVKVFFEYRIEDKILVEVFRKIDKEENGYLNLDKLKTINDKNLLNFSTEEMNDILNFFNMEEYIKSIKENKYINDHEYSTKFDFKKFSDLYYQGD
jgi:Ca2+-binding EF-hand superfamily protein